MNLLRNFIYLNTDKIKSIYSQIEQGLILESSSEKNNQKSVEGQIEGKASLFELLGIDAKAMSELLTQNKKTETKTLHDHMYNYIENKLVSEEYITKINCESLEIKNKWEEKKLTEKINTGSLVLIECLIRIEDYVYMKNLFEKFNDLLIAVDILSKSDREDYNKNNHNWKNTKKEMKIKSELMNDDFVKSFSTVLNNIYSKRILVKAFPFPDNNNLNFLGPIKKEYLRDDIEEIILKYGFSSNIKWNVFGEISLIPEEKIKINDHNYKNNNIDSLDFAFETIFDSIDELNKETKNKSSVTFTPIAIYHETNN